MKIKIFTYLFPLFLLTSCDTPDYYTISNPTKPAATLSYFKNFNNMNIANSSSSMVLTIDQKAIGTDHPNNIIKVAPGIHDLAISLRYSKYFIYGCATNLKLNFKANKFYQVNYEIKNSIMTTWLEDENHSRITTTASCDPHLPHPPPEMIIFGMMNSAFRH